MIFILLPIATWLGYHFRQIYRVVLSGQTAGIRNAGIEIICLGTDDRLTFLRAMTRIALPIVAATAGMILALITRISELLWVSALCWLFFPLSVLWNRSRHGWHDLAADAVVVVSEESEARRSA
ncbi:RDD family protein [Candidatus Poriferisodalis sp.]|uniref:RDD family protein n=1 Tax=Candidatus Poriferisodalis sp. TaxID=3101277 RepID=UPI003B5C3AFF